MKRRLALLAAAGLVRSSSHSFSVTDDLLAYPQYEVIFSDSFISHNDAVSRLSSPQFSPSSSAEPSTETQADLSRTTTSDGASHDEHAHSASSSSSSSTTSQPSPSFEKMILNSTPYLCSIPPPPPPEPPKNKTAAHLGAAEETAELARATDRGWELLREMNGSCLYFISGWWSYQFCYSQSVKQFHPLPPGRNVPMYPPIEDPGTPSYILGKFGEKRVNRHRLAASKDTQPDAKSDSSPNGLSPLSASSDTTPSDEVSGTTTTIQAKGSSSSRYLSQKLTGGTLCDLTGAPRRVEIQFHCHPQSTDRIGWIKEISTCSYLMVVYTPRLCNDVAFLPQREERAEQVICQEIIPSDPDSEKAWRRKKSQEAERKLIGQVAGYIHDARLPQADTRKMVGDIEVGGMKLVGGDKGWLTTAPPPGSAAAANKKGNQAIAHQHRAEEGGAIHKLSEKEMRSLGVDVKLANQAIRELQDVAGGKGWRLEVVDSEDGRMEMRGVIDDDDNDSRGNEIEIVILDEDDQVGGPGEEQYDEQGGTEEEYKDEL